MATERDRKKIATGLKGVKGRERCGNYSNVEEMLKRKREDLKEDSDGEGEEGFNRSKKTPRSPQREGKEEERDWKGAIKRWRIEMEGIREWKEKIKQIKVEIKE